MQELAAIAETTKSTLFVVFTDVRCEVGDSDGADVGGGFLGTDGGGFVGVFGDEVGVGGGAFVGAVGKSIGG